MLPNSRALGARAAGAGNMLVTCAAAFNPKVWTYAMAPRKPKASERADKRDYQSRRRPLRSAILM